MAEQKNNDYSNKQIIFVTGANKGIGFELCKALLKHDNVFVILGCRNFNHIPKANNDKKSADHYEFADGDDKSGKTRIELLRDFKFKGIKNIDFVEIDITNKESVKDAANKIKEKYNNIDMLVNNAGMAFKGNAFDINVVNTTLTTNYYGTINATSAMLPLIKDGGRIIMTSSRAGLIDDQIFDKNIQKGLVDNNLTIDYLENVLKQFKDAVTKDKSLPGGIFKASAYGMSKVAMSAYSRIIAKEVTNRNIFVAAYCPGYCSTYMSSGGGNRSASNGSRGLELLCTEKLSMDKTGQFWMTEFTDKKNDNSTAKLCNHAWNK